MDFIILNEVNTHPGDETSISLGCNVVALSDGGKSHQHEGYGTAAMAKLFDPNTDSITCRHAEHELSSIRCEVANGVFFTIIGLYLSPNADASVTRSFFRELEKLVTAASQDDLVILGGDANAPVGSARFRKLEELRCSHKGFRIINSCTRGNSQLDHVYAFYDPTNFTVSGIVIDGVSDHQAIVVDISSSTIVTKREVWCKKRVITDRGDDEIISDQLEHELSKFKSESFEDVSLIASLNA